MITYAGLAVALVVYYLAAVWVLAWAIDRYSDA